MCQCLAKDRVIEQLSKKCKELHSQRLTVQGQILRLMEQKEERIRELQAQLTRKEEEVRTLHGSFRSASTEVVACKEEAWVLQQELEKAEGQLLKVGSFRPWAEADPTAAPSPPVHIPQLQICCQAVQADALPRMSSTFSAFSDDLRSARSARSARSDDLGAYFEELQELRHTVKVLTEELEELRTATPRSPPISPLVSPGHYHMDLRTCKSVPSPRTFNGLEGPWQYLYFRLVDSEAVSRSALSLDEDARRRELAALAARHCDRLELMGALRQQLEDLEGLDRRSLDNAELIGRSTILYEFDHWYRQSLSSVASSIGDESNVMDDPNEPHRASSFCSVTTRTVVMKPTTTEVHFEEPLESDLDQLPQMLGLQSTYWLASGMALASPRWR
eukprot:EG_transcript_11611